MRRGLRLVVALAWTAFGCAAEEAPDRETADAGDLADAGSMYDGLSCEQLVKEVWKLPRECDDTTPCTLVGTSCTPSRLFIAVNYSGWERATALHDVMRKSGCSLGWDGWYPRAACISGLCEEVDTDRNCMPTGNRDWDAGDRGRIDGGTVVEGGTSDSAAIGDGAISDGAFSDGAIVTDDATMRDF